jgi:hypothetical protein
MPTEVEFSMRHPRDSSKVATYGRNDRDGFWAKLVWNGALVTYDKTFPSYDNVWPLRGLLTFLATVEFLDLAEVEEALSLFDERSHGPRGWPGERRPRRGVQAVLTVIRDLDTAGG